MNGCVLNLRNSTRKTRLDFNTESSYLARPTTDVKAASALGDCSQTIERQSQIGRLVRSDGLHHVDAGGTGCR